jgi:hypothetical protein
MKSGRNGHRNSAPKILAILISINLAMGQLPKKDETGGIIVFLYVGRGHQSS